MENSNSRLDQAEERLRRNKDRSIDIFQLKKQKEKRMKKSEDYVISGIPSKQPICELLKFQKEKRGIKGQKTYLK